MMLYVTSNSVQPPGHLTTTNAAVYHPDLTPGEPYYHILWGCMLHWSHFGRAICSLHHNQWCCMLPLPHMSHLVTLQQHMMLYVTSAWSDSSTANDAVCYPRWAIWSLYHNQWCCTLPRPWVSHLYHNQMMLYVTSGEPSGHFTTTNDAVCYPDLEWAILTTTNDAVCYPRWAIWSLYHNEWCMLPRPWVSHLYHNQWCCLLPRPWVSHPYHNQWCCMSPLPQFSHLVTVQHTTLYVTSMFISWIHIDGLVQERCNSIANVLELHSSCTNSSKWLAEGNSLMSILFT